MSRNNVFYTRVRSVAQRDLKARGKRYPLQYHFNRGLTRSYLFPRADTSRSIMPDHDRRLDGSTARCTVHHRQTLDGARYTTNRQPSWVSGVANLVSHTEIKTLIQPLNWLISRRTDKGRVVHGTLSSVYRAVHRALGGGSA